MAEVTICGDFGAQENSLSLFPLFPHLFAMKWWDWMPWSSFFECCFKPTFSLSSFTFIKRLFSYSLLSAISVVSSAFLRLLIFLPAISIPALSVYWSIHPSLKGVLPQQCVLVSCFLTAATAKSLQLCPTLWDPIDSSPPGSFVHGILQSRTLEWVAISSLLALGKAFSKKRKS